jgi:hypothetical protein
MTAAKSDFRRYIDSTQGLPPDVVLGWIAIYQVRDGSYDRTVMEQAFEDLDMQTSLLPAPNNPLHAFQKATSSVNDSDYKLPNGDICHVLVREAKSTPEMLVRQLTREVRDPRRGKLGYSPIGECVYFRPRVEGGRTVPGSERCVMRVDSSTLTSDEAPVLTGLIRQMQAEYDRHVNFIDAMKYRQVIRDYLLYLNALKVKDGFYFVHANRMDELDKLRTLVERMGNGTTLWTMPLVDLGEQRKMVIDAYQTEAEESLNDVIKKIQHVRSTRKSVTPEAYAKLMGEYKAAVDRSKEYARTLKVRGTTTLAAEELALDALASLQMEMIAG